MSRERPSKAPDSQIQAPAGPSNEMRVRQVKQPMKPYEEKTKELPTYATPRASVIDFLAGHVRDEACVCVCSAGQRTRLLSLFHVRGTLVSGDVTQIETAVRESFDDSDLPCSRLGFQLFDKDFHEWVDIDCSTPVANLSKLRVVFHVSHAVSSRQDCSHVGSRNGLYSTCACIFYSECIICVSVCGCWKDLIDIQTTAMEESNLGQTPEGSDITSSTRASSRNSTLDGNQMTPFELEADTVEDLTETEYGNSCGITPGITV